MAFQVLPQSDAAECHSLLQSSPDIPDPETDSSTVRFVSSAGETPEVHKQLDNEQRNCRNEGDEDKSGESLKGAR